MKKLALLALGVFITACGETPTETPTLDSSAEPEFVFFDSTDLPATWLPRANSVTGVLLSDGCSFINSIGSSSSNGVGFVGFAFFRGEVITVSATSELTAQTMELWVQKTAGVYLVQLSTGVPGTLTYSMPEDGTYSSVGFARGDGVGEMVFSCDGPAAIPVTIDIKPGSDPNTVNIDAENSVVAVAILTTDDFDATSVDHNTLLFEGVPEMHVDKKTGEAKRHEEDVDGDGDTDLLMHVRVGDTGFDESSTVGTLTGETYDGAPIQGTDAVRPIWQVASVTGSGHFTWWTGERRTMTFNARQFNDGSVGGQWQLYNRELEVKAHGDVVCMSFDGNQAFLGGLETKPNDGDGVVWAVEDNGQPGDDPPDRMTVQQAGQSLGEVVNFCNGQDLGPLVWIPVEEGNFTVRN